MVAPAGFGGRHGGTAPTKNHRFSDYCTSALEEERGSGRREGRLSEQDCPHWLCFLLFFDQLGDSTGEGSGVVDSSGVGSMGAGFSTVRLS